MNWQEIVKKYDLDVSEVNFDELIGRVDAEYYKPLYIENIQKIKRKSYKLLKEVSIKITDFGAYSQNSWIQYLESGEYIFIRNQDIEGYFIKSGEKIYISEEVYQKLSLHLEERDILIQRAGTLGKASIVLSENLPSTANQNLAQVKVNETLISPFYLIAFLNCFYGISSFERLATGNVQPWLNLEQINNLPIPIPSNTLQSELTSIIISAKRHKDESSSLYSQAEQLLLAELGLADYISNEANTSIRDLFECLQDDRFDAEYWMPKYDEIATVIRNYKNGYDTLDNLFVIGSQAGINTESTYRYIELADVNSTLGTIENYTELLGKDLPSRGRMSLKKDDVIMSSLDGSLDKTALITIDEQNLIGSTGFFVLRKKYFEPEVALVFLKSRPIQEYIARQAQGTILTAIPKTSLSRIVLPKISNEIQSKVKKLIKDAHSQKELSKRQLEKAKRAVEIFIEQDEAKALEYLAT